MIMEVETSFFMILLGTRAVKMSFTFPLYLVSIRFYACSLCWQKRAMAPFINIGSFFHTLFPHSLNHDVSDFPFSPVSFLILYLSFFSLYIYMYGHKSGGNVSCFLDILWLIDRPLPILAHLPRYKSFRGWRTNSTSQFDRNTY